MNADQNRSFIGIYMGYTKIARKALQLDLSILKVFVKLICKLLLYLID